MLCAVVVALAFPWSAHSHLSPQAFLGVAVHGEQSTVDVAWFCPPLHTGLAI